MTKQGIIMSMKRLCIGCKEEVLFAPFHNAGKEKKYVGDVPYCNNSECPRFGLLSLVTTQAMPSRKLVDLKTNAEIKKDND